MEISEMTLPEVEARMAEMNQQLDSAEAPIEGFEEEMRSLVERKAELAEIEQRKKDAEALANGEAQPEKIIEVVKTEEKRNMFDRNSVEYRDAFFAMLRGVATAEQRDIFADNTNYGDGVALPVATDTAIWDQILSQHPILSDVSVIRSGIVMKVPQMTPANLPTGKKDSAAATALTFTAKDVVLAGEDYVTSIGLSFAERRMSAGAMESFLVNEISNVLGEQIATAVFARILTDASANSITKSGTYFEAIHDCLGAATMANVPVIYAPAALYYAILGEVDSNKQPIVRDGVVLGATLKKDNAATKITVVDPSLFVLNMVNDIEIRQQEDVANAKVIIGGYARAEGCLRKTNAAAFIA